MNVNDTKLLCHKHRFLDLDFKFETHVCYLRNPSLINFNDTTTTREAENSYLSTHTLRTSHESPNSYLAQPTKLFPHSTFESHMPKIVPSLQPLQQQHDHFRAAFRHVVEEQHVRVHFVHLPELGQRFGHVTGRHGRVEIRRRRGRRCRRTRDAAAEEGDGHAPEEEGDEHGQRKPRRRRPATHSRRD